MGYYLRDFSEGRHWMRSGANLTRFNALGLKMILMLAGSLGILEGKRKGGGGSVKKTMGRRMLDLI